MPPRPRHSADQVSGRASLANGPKTAGDRIHRQSHRKHHGLPIRRSTTFRSNEATSALGPQYSRELCGSPQPCRPQLSPSSCGSMLSNRDDLTPEADSSQDESPASQPAATTFSRLRIKAETPPSHEHRRKSPFPQKRPAHGSNHAPCQKYQKHESWHGSASQRSYRDVKPRADCRDAVPKTTKDDRHDSLFELKEVRGPLPAVTEALLIVYTKSKASLQVYREEFADPNSTLIPQDSLHLRGKRRWAGIDLQPEFSPISQEQLATEVKGIYAGLVMVEAKCINIDSQKASHPDEPIDADQWQSLVAIHRTLLYEHHDFLMATQHPSANPALLGLATKYSMPARMWKHGIHAFLEVLRHRRPESQEYMLAFIYLAYQMISLLLETVSGFKDTWIECLGDLARYRMAIEEDREIHNIWGGTAGRWYALAADRNPSVGRLYHHSGILERPSLRKFYLYARALTSVFPFVNAKESLGTLCIPMLEDEHARNNAIQSAEWMTICFQAGIFLNRETEQTQQDGRVAVTLLTEQTSAKFALYGVSLAVTNVAALFGFGSSDNVHRQLYESALNRETLDSRPSQENTLTPQSSTDNLLLDLKRAQHPSDSAYHFCFHVFNITIRRAKSRDSISDFLPYVHITLVFLNSINTLRSRLTSDETLIYTTGGNLFDTTMVDWTAFSHFLNIVANFYPITSRTESFAGGETFPKDGKPLHEDFLIRGLVWSQWYFAPDWFDNIEDDDGSRSLEDPRTRQNRAARVLYLGMVLAQKTACLSYNRSTRRFSASSPSSADAVDTARSSDESPFDGDYVLVPDDVAAEPQSHKPYVRPSRSQERAGTTPNRQQQRRSILKAEQTHHTDARVQIVSSGEEVGWA